MESSDEQLRVKVLETWERQPKVIDGTILQGRLTDNSRTIFVGNTGLMLTLKEEGESIWVGGHFMPGGYSGDVEQDAIPDKDAIKMFFYGIHKFRDWARNSGDIDYHKLGTFKNVTSDKFRGFLKKFFSKYGHGDLVKSDYKLPDDPRMVSLELGDLLELPDDDPLVERISAAAKRAEGTVVMGLVKTS